ncbi:MAG: FecR family protein [Polyangiaceae bacterium]
MGTVKPDDPDYLFDGEGAPDPDVAKLEAKLAPLRYQPRALDATAAAPRRTGKPHVLRRWPLWAGGLAVAAAVALLVRGEPRPTEGGPAFAVTRIQGAPRVGASPVGDRGRLPVGAWLETDATSQAQVRVADIGAIDVAPSSRLRLVGTAPNEHRLELTRGAITAKVTAPPRIFVIDTPAATAVDLGCAYHLEVGPDGETARLRVDSGEVSLEGKGRSAWVPAGALCDTRRSTGPGTPFAADAPPAMIAALARFDFERGGRAAAAAALAAARPRDVLSVWHVFRRGDAETRAEARALMVAWRVVSRHTSDVDIDRMAPAKVIWPDPITDW